MKKIFLFYLDTLFGVGRELRVRMFHVLAITGFLICVIMTGVSVAGRMWVSASINTGAGLFSLGLLIYSAQSGHYRFCYGMSIAVIFFILFPSLFLYGGGYRGGMPFFFVFAVVFTVYMLDGWKMIAVTGVELSVYSFLIWMVFRCPEIVVPLGTEAAVVTDLIIGLITVSISLGATMFVQVRMYQRQQEQLEQAQKTSEAASEAKSLFLANMSHEIRTPIHMILGMNEIIHRESKSRQVREYSEKIDETSKMLLSLVDNVLDVSKIESGKMELMPDAYDRDNLVRTLVLIGQTSCKRKGLQFRFHIAEDLPRRIYGDLAHIRQIAANFLSNAVKYTEKGTVTLEMNWEPGAGNEEFTLLISVEDTGSGIHPEALPTLFDAFTRADLEAHRYIEGTGLGLKIVKELTDLMGGTVSVESEPGAGSRFSVRIPQRILPENAEQNRGADVTFEAPDVRILVVDDNEGNRMVMRELLSPTGIKVDTANSGAECLLMVQENRYHLILMDYMMPEMDGLETVKRLRQSPDFKTPVIGLTADATAGAEQKMIGSGFASVLTKPVPWTRLRDAMLAHLPRDMVTLRGEQSIKRESEPLPPELSGKMKTYGIDLGEAMPYFGHSLSNYEMMAESFLRYEEAEREKIQIILETNDDAMLRFPIHALKGKAKNLGMVQLAEVCAHAEKLSLSGQQQALRSLMPYLQYLWEQGVKGLCVLIEELKPQPGAEQSKSCNGNCRDQLVKFLEEFRRKPALDCIERLIQQEPSEQGKQSLINVRRLVDDFSFEEAESVFRSYLLWEKGENIS